jgi:hypothetical protein
MISIDVPHVRILAISGTGLCCSASSIVQIV